MAEQEGKSQRNYEGKLEPEEQGGEHSSERSEVDPEKDQEEPEPCGEGSEEKLGGRTVQTSGTGSLPSETP